MRNMSFSHTCDQLLGRSKDVTRRLGWESVQPGELLSAVRKSRGLKKGEKVERLGMIRVLSRRRERLDAITQADVVREGYPKWKPADFIQHFCKSFGCRPETVITRIVFEYMESDS